MAFVSLGAFAEGANEIPKYFLHPQSTPTRAQLGAELAQARVRGELQDEGYRFKFEAATRSRWEGMAELREAKRLGLTDGDAGVPEQEAQITKAGAASRERYLPTRSLGTL